MRVLITRPIPRAEQLARAVRARGHDPVMAPLLAIHHKELAPLDLANVQALVVTSINAPPAITGAARALPVFTVGEATAAAARAAGCTRVIVGGGDARSLAPLIAQRLDPATGDLVHPAGEHVRPGLDIKLAQAGFTLRRVAVYRAEAATRLPDDVCQMLADGSLEAVTLFSPRTAAVFSQLVHAHGLTKSLSKVTLLCLSEAVASEVAMLSGCHISVAERSDQSALVDLLDGPVR